MKRTESEDAENSTSLLRIIPQYFAQAAGSIAREGYRALVSHIDADNFRWLLIRWIVCMHIALTVVECQEFRDLVNYIAPALEDFLVQSATTVRTWILKAFEKQKHLIKKKLAKARTVHISFDLWTGINHRSLVGVVAHWLDEDFIK
jgi:hypothetical protein